MTAMTRSTDDDAEDDDHGDGDGGAEVISW